jgi:hypothetical protein
MLKEVQDVIKRIEAFLADNDNFETVIEDDYLAIRVFARDGDPTIYHGYELFLMEKVVQKLGFTLDFKLDKSEGFERFLVTTEANFNLMSYINSTNQMLRSHQDDMINTVYLTEKLSEDSRGEFTILTGFTNGTWTRCDITKAELLFAAVNDLPISTGDTGIFWYADLIAMNNELFDEVEASHNSVE